MKRTLIFFLVILATLAIAFSSAMASSTRQDETQADASVVTLPASALDPGNYCASCHLPDDPRLATVTAWNGSIARIDYSPCPAAATIYQELYYTERMLLMIDRAEASVGTLPEKTQARLDDYTQRYSRMLDHPVTSLDAFVNEAQAIRYQLNKVYATLNNMAEAAKLRTVLIYAAGITLVVLGSLAWGLYNTRLIRSALVSRRNASFWRLAFILAVLAFFILPIFRVPPAEATITTTAQQEAQATLDTAQRLADAADRAQARAWMLARIATTWSDADPTQAQTVFGDALSALKTAGANEQALWGQSLVVQEATIGIPVDMLSASLIADELNAGRLRSWALPLVAIEWSSLDPEKAASMLQAEQAAIERHGNVYRDLQMRSLALAWVGVDPAQAFPVAAKITDPAVRSWTMRELADLTHEQALYTPAAEAAREVSDPIQRLRLLGQVAAASGQAELFDEAGSALETASGAPLAYALAELAVASGDVALIDRIDPSYPDAIATAYLRLGEYQPAWEAALKINDPYERARAQASIASAWQNAEAALQITVPLYRDIALRDITVKTGNASWVDSIGLPYYQIQALTGFGDLQAAAGLAGEVGDTYPLVALAVAMADTDQQAALTLVDSMSREAEKAAALQAIALVTGDKTLLEQAQGMALASRVRGDALAPAQASLNLAQAFRLLGPEYTQVLLQQAYEATLRIAVK